MVRQAAVALELADAPVGGGVAADAVAEAATAEAAAPVGDEASLEDTNSPDAGKSDSNVEAGVEVIVTGATTEEIQDLAIDGANILSPGVFRLATMAFKLFESVFVATTPFHIGPTTL